jgi:cytochrome d ubiquinol oxidase subunit II
MRQKAARTGVATTRWVAAGMVAVSLILALTNPAIYYRWTHSESLHVGIGSWLIMLAVFVYLERALRMVAARPDAPVWWTPLVAAGALNVMMLLGLVYSYFPFLVLDELTVWDAAASRESLRWVMAAAVAAAPILLVFNVLGYWRLFRYKPVRTEV